MGKIKVTRAVEGNSDNPVARYNVDERVRITYNGTCKKGQCVGESACTNIDNTSYTCICPHDGQPPTANGGCPRITVPLNQSGTIPYVQPPLSDIVRTDFNSSSLPVSHSSVMGTSPYRNYYIFGGSFTAFCTILLLAIVIRRKVCSRNRNDSLASPLNLKHSLLMAKRYAPNPQYIPCAGAGVPLLRKETLTFLNEIGEGCFGKVFKGEYFVEAEKPEIVAVKVLKENATREAEEDFLREVEIMSAFRHPNILSLLGVVPRDEYLNPMMVFEYMPLGDLAELLRTQKKTNDADGAIELSKRDLLFFALQIARGMRYLAAQRFVHRDLACRNCLVADGLVVKIADFGMSRDVYTCDYYKIGGSRLLPVRWMSPESVVYGRFTLDSDIWSYGVVLWEIYSYGKQPYYGHTNEEVVKLILDGIMLIPPTDCPSLICELMRNCWKTEPRDRIRFSNVCDKLEVEYESCDDCRQIEEEINVSSNEDKDSKKKLNTVERKLPRPPPITVVLENDLLDAEGYLLPNEVKNPAQYLETLPG